MIELTTTSITLNSTEELIADMRAGRMVVLMDDEDRENEGDIVMAATHVRPEDINFMARYARGLICLTLTREHCEQLRLPLMVTETYARQTTNFTVSIEAREGVTTGISAADRARTIQAAVAPNAQPADLTMPGHIFPLMAQPGGVLTRAGHTEAGCDLAALAGITPAAVIVEILNDDGTMARRPQLEQFAREHHLKIGTIADLIHYRLHNEKTVRRITSSEVATEWGPFTLHVYEEHHGAQLHWALTRGTWSATDEVPVRVHLEDPLSDNLGMRRAGVTWSLRAAMARVAQEPRGIVVILRHHEANEELVRRIKDLTPSEPHPKAMRPADAVALRTYGVGAQIVADLGVTKMRVLGTPKRMLGLAGFGLEVVGYIDRP